MLQVPAQISKVTTLAHGTLRAQVDTKDVSADDTATLFGLFGKSGTFVFSEEGVSGLPAVNDTIEQQLRKVMYRYFLVVKQGKKPAFGAFYRKEIARIIKLYQEKL